MKTVYKIFFKDETTAGKWKGLVLNYSNLASAREELKRLEKQEKKAREKGAYTESCGAFSVSIPCGREIVKFKIMKRNVSPWQDVLLDE